MEQIDTYRTLSDCSEGIFKEKGSKFIAYAAPCFSEQESKELLEEWRKKHHQARHLCYAYRLGLDKKTYRTNDDGEPNNSAGIPIFGQIQSYDLTNVLIGVIRYFGGTKLGVGGLIQAYKTAAKEAIEAGSIIENQVQHHLELHFNYDQIPVVMQLIKQLQLTLISQHFELNCELKLVVPFHHFDSFESQLKQLEIEFKHLGIK